jgi:small subunit ribosomal protein S8
MSLSDPISDMLNRIRNASGAGLKVAEVTYSKMKSEIAVILKKEGFVREVSIDGAGTKKVINLVLKYDAERKPTIKGLRRISKPGLRRYVGFDKIPRVLGGMGVAILSTPSGIMTDNEARQRRVGGELLCQVW